jgi:hypothetical protein
MSPPVHEHDSDDGERDHGGEHEESPLARE